MAEIQYRCEVAEKKRVRSAWERSQEEKRVALQKAAEEAEKKKQEEMKNLTETLARKLRNEAALQREIALGEALAVARVILIFFLLLSWGDSHMKGKGCLLSHLGVQITDFGLFESVQDKTPNIF